jgi:hypothetical protein
VLPAYPQYLSGFLQALEPVPSLVGFVVEAISTAFARLPDTVLLPWLPTLITTLRKEGGDLAPLLVREAGRVFPGGLAAVDAWIAPWSAAAIEPVAARSTPRSAPVTALLVGHPQACDALAELLGCDGPWVVGGVPAADHPAHDLLRRHPQSAQALLATIGAA